MKRYNVVASVIGECCSSPHLYHKRIQAAGPMKACQRFKAELVEKGLDVGDMHAFPPRKRRTP
jgi:hypothetical protein